MPDLSAPDYQLARIAIERGLGAIYLIAFTVAATQFPALCGERGLEPATRILRATRFLRTPSLFHFGYSDTRLRVLAVVGAPFLVERLGPRLERHVPRFEVPGDVAGQAR